MRIAYAQIKHSPAFTPAIVAGGRAIHGPSNRGRLVSRRWRVVRIAAVGIASGFVGSAAALVRWFGATTIFTRGVPIRA